MVLHEMAHHQPPVEPLRKPAQLFRLGQLKCERLFHEDMLARLEGPLRESVVERGRNGDDDRIDGGIGEHGLEAGGLQPMRGGLGPDSVSIEIDHGCQRAELGEIADEVLTPVAATDHGNTHGLYRRRVGCSQRSVLRLG